MLELDLSGLMCPLPILKTKKFITFLITKSCKYNIIKLNKNHKNFNNKIKLIFL